jgi:hypothetical protein
LVVDCKTVEVGWCEMVRWWAPSGLALFPLPHHTRYLVTHAKHTHADHTRQRHAPTLSILAYCWCTVCLSCLWREEPTLGTSATLWRNWAWPCGAGGGWRLRGGGGWGVEDTELWREWWIAHVPATVSTAFCDQDVKSCTNPSKLLNILVIYISNPTHLDHVVPHDVEVRLVGRHRRLDDVKHLVGGWTGMGGGQWL